MVRVHPCLPLRAASAIPEMSQVTITLPDGSSRTVPAGTPLHEKGLEPTVSVDEPDVEFGQAPPPGDPVLDKALERLSEKKAA